MRFAYFFFVCVWFKRGGQPRDHVEHINPTKNKDTRHASHPLDADRQTEKSICGAYVALAPH
ncbi:MAG TPA: hypothetical protein DEF21_04155 [Thalassospira lucentensis]|uniref:Uncharacterized protein n=1 Tax=Thalassospira lucentensis TaxID=168935 RepID=A0A358HPI4_9PROT|nr:hypothetical protein [Thalassospira lucentensis]HCW66423.1 hypothetical protein [Thalassospira lucentensis]